MHRKIQLVVKSLAILVCLVCLFGGNHPPSFAQSNGQVVQVPVLTVEDAVQDNNIKELNEHLVATDARVQKQWDSINKNGADIAGMLGEERIAFAILGLLGSVSLVVTIRKKNI